MKIEPCPDCRARAFLFHRSDQDGWVVCAACENNCLNGMDFRYEKTVASVKEADAKAVAQWNNLPRWGEAKEKRLKLAEAVCEEIKEVCETNTLDGNTDIGWRAHDVLEEMIKKWQAAKEKDDAKD